MAFPVLIAIVVGIILYEIYKYVFYKPKNFPPGPPRLPFVGSYFFLLLANYNHKHRATERLAKYYNTKVLGCYFKNIPTIIVHDLKICHEVLNNADCANRPKYTLAKFRSPTSNGLFFTDGEFWRDQRRFTLRHLRNFGLGPRSHKLEDDINDELLEMVDLFKNGPKYEYEHKYCKDGAFEFPLTFTTWPANILLEVIIGKRYDRQRVEVLHRAAVVAHDFHQTIDPFGRLFNVIEFTKYILPNLSGYKPFLESAEGLHIIIKDIVEKEYNTYDPAHMRHFLDIYIKEMKSGDDDTHLIDQLIQIIIDCMFPALSDLSTQLAFLFQRLMMNPQILSKCQEEIDRVVDKNRLPGLDDRTNLSYTEACIRESLRLDTITPNNVPHMTSSDTKIDKYVVPAGTMIITNLQVAHESEEYFIDAKKFKPERFLNENGEFDVKLDTTIPFGAGRRSCGGETYARNILFLMTSTIIQKFNFRLPVGHKLHDPRLEECPSGFAKYPMTYWMKFEQR